MDLQALKTEITTDPEGLGYAGKDDVETAELLNAGGRQVDRDSVTGGEIAASLVRAEMADLTAAEREHVRALMAAGDIPLTANFKNEMRTVFPDGSTTRANILAILKRDGSRAQELGLGNVTPSHVAKARALP